MCLSLFFISFGGFISGASYPTVRKVNFKIRIVKYDTRLKCITVVDVGYLGVPFILIEAKNGYGFISLQRVYVYYNNTLYVNFITMYSFNLLNVLVFHFR